MRMTLEEFQEMDEIWKQWEETFGDRPPFGIIGCEIGPAQFPLLRKCLKQKSKKPWDRYAESKLKKGLIY